MTMITVIAAVIILLLVASTFYLRSRSSKTKEITIVPSQRDGVTASEERALEGPENSIGAESAELPADLKRGAGKTRFAFTNLVSKLSRSQQVNQGLWDEVEETLLLSDLGLPLTERVIEGARSRVRMAQDQSGVSVLSAIRSELKLLFVDENRDINYSDSKPSVWLVVGVNGVGKTTSIGKLSAMANADGKSVVLAAGDTFRAAAVDQLETWAERTDADLVRSVPGADPSSVVFDAIQKAAARGYDLVIADTAGRLHTKFNLMEELKKLRRTAEREPGHLSEVLLVLDATTGQNGLTQARQFSDAAQITGVILTKLDGSAKGGIALSVEADLGVPIKLVGVGEQSRDLIPFVPDEFLDLLLQTDDDGLSSEVIGDN